MDTTQDQSHHLQQSQLQKIAPHLIQASEILQCTALELRQTIERELMENPALESVEATPDRCSDCELPPGVCTSCPFMGRRSDSPADLVISNDDSDVKRADDQPESFHDNEREDSDRDDSEPDYDIGPLLALSELTDPHVKEEFIEDSFDPLSLAPSLPSLRDHLISRLRSMTSGEQSHKIADYLVASLDERGWLKLDRVEAMVELSITEDVLDEHIAALHACDPSGIGARDLRECLLIQLEHLEDDDRGHPLAKTLVRDHWELLHQRRYDQLARRTGSNQVAVADAVRFIQNELSPAPASQYREPWDYKPDSTTEAIKPDVIIRRTSTGFDVEITGLELPTLHINARYRRMYETMRAEREQRQKAVSNGGGPAAVTSRTYAGVAYAENGRASLGSNAKSMSSDRGTEKMSIQERKHISQYVERANLFLKNIQQRKKTIERITRCLIEAQQGFIETGSRAFLIPITRTDLAHRAGLHESTVSRALLRKFVQLPTQDVISFDAFFAPAGSVKDQIAAIIASEDAQNPYSDETLRAKLKERGVEVARRTIVKYRESLRIPASYLRRQH